MRIDVHKRLSSVHNRWAGVRGSSESGSSMLWSKLKECQVVVLKSFEEY